MNVRELCLEDDDEMTALCTIMDETAVQIKFRTLAVQEGSFTSECRLCPRIRFTRQYYWV